MPVNIGDYSTSINQEFRASDVRCSGISAPTLGQRASGTTVTVTFTLLTYVDADLLASVTIEYSTAGAGGPWTAASITGAVTNLTVSQAGNTYNVTWDSIADVGSNVDQDNILIRVTANDGALGAGDDDTPVVSSFFTVDNLPTAPTITAPSSGWFRKDDDYPSFAVEFTIPTDPGSDKLWPVFEADKSPNFDSVDFFQVDSNDLANYLYFDVEVSNPLKPISGYYVIDVPVNEDGSITTVTYSSLTDAYTGSALPGTITDARVLVVNRMDRRVLLSSVGNTQVQLTASQAGVITPTVDLYIFDDVQTNFYIVSGLTVTNEALTSQLFSGLADDFGQSIPVTFGSAPRILMCDENDKLCFMGAISTTDVELAKSVAGPDIDGAVTLFILKDNTDIYQDDNYAVNFDTLTVTRYDALSDGGALPTSIGGAIPNVVPNSDRAVYVDTPTAEDFQIAKSGAGLPTNGTAEINIFTEEGASGIWVVMPATGIDDATFEGGNARYRAQVGDFDDNVWYFRAAFGNT